MKSKEERDEICSRLLKMEILPATGCTEPGAIAYAAAVARMVLGRFPDDVEIWVSGNILKNAKSVIIPGSKKLHGIVEAALCGIIADSPDKKLEIFNELTPKMIETVRLLAADKSRSSVHLWDGTEPLYIRVLERAEGHSSEVEIQKSHLNITKVMYDQKKITEKYWNQGFTAADDLEKKNLNLEDCYLFAQEADLSKWRELIDKQISYNEKISEEGLKNSYGAEIGRILYQNSKRCPRMQLVAYAAAGSDARMGGCALPVVTNSGSGNQGITISVPIIKYAEQRQIQTETVERAVLFADLISIYIKSGIGALSAYCGAVSAGCASACGIAFLDGQSLEVIADIVTNSLGTISGILCDGAKASCAAKIAVSVQMGLLAYDMAKQNRRFREGEGIIGKNVDKTVEAVGILGKYGMRETDWQILKLMTQEQ